MDMDCLPYCAYIHSKILMNQEVSQRYHLPPRNVRVSALNCDGNAIACFSYNLKIPDNCIYCFVIPFKMFEIVPFEILSNTTHRGLNIFKEHFITTFFLSHVTRMLPDLKSYPLFVLLMHFWLLNQSCVRKHLQGKFLMKSISIR